MWTAIFFLVIRWCGDSVRRWFNIASLWWFGEAVIIRTSYSSVRRWGDYSTNSPLYLAPRTHEPCVPTSSSCSRLLTFIRFAHEVRHRFGIIKQACFCAHLALTFDLRPLTSDFWLPCVPLTRPIWTPRARLLVWKATITCSTALFGTSKK